jgi:WXXGXW repeat (2 copies)
MEVAARNESETKINPWLSYFSWGSTLKKTLITVVFGIGLGMAPAFADEVVVRVRPPRAVVEHRVVAPSGRHVWIAGYHRWDGNAYVWTPGRWELPPREHVVWVAPRWRHRHDGWVFVEGRWR